jgi:hypothetical protein
MVEGEQVERGVAVLRRLGSVKDAEVGEEHGDWELRERGALVASLRKCRVRERGKETRRMGSVEPHISRGMAGRRMVDPDALDGERTKIAMQQLRHAGSTPSTGVCMRIKIHRQLMQGRHSSEGESGVRILSVVAVPEVCYVDT